MMKNYQRAGKTTGVRVKDHPLGRNIVLRNKEQKLRIMVAQEHHQEEYRRLEITRKLST